MKLKQVIASLDKFRHRYVEKHGCEPEIWDVTDIDDDTLEFMLVSRVTKKDGTRMGHVPHMHRLIRIGNRKR